jgi:hypothetical protein
VADGQSSAVDQGPPEDPTEWSSTCFDLGLWLQKITALDNPQALPPLSLPLKVGAAWAGWCDVAQVLLGWWWGGKLGLGWWDGKLGLLECGEELVAAKGGKGARLLGAGAYSATPAADCNMVGADPAL